MRLRLRTLMALVLVASVGAWAYVRFAYPTRREAYRYLARRYANKERASRVKAIDWIQKAIAADEEARRDAERYPEGHSMHHYVRNDEARAASFRRLSIEERLRVTQFRQLRLRYERAASRPWLFPPTILLTPDPLVP